MKVMFVSSPYSADTDEGIDDNILKAEKVSTALMSKGWYVITPPKNTGRCEKYKFLSGEEGYKFLLAMYIEILSRCDAIIMCKGWKESEGCRGEYKFAMENGIHIFFEEDGIPDLNILGE